MPSINNLSISAFFLKLDSSQKGLTEVEAQGRLLKYGKNKFSNKNISALYIFIRQIKNFFVLLLILASILCFITNDFTDGVVILVILTVNTFIGFIQEYRSEKASEALSLLISSTSLVKRDGIKRNIDKDFITIGDIIILEQGDIVPADARIIISNDMFVDESILTGETIAQMKTIDSSNTSTDIMKSTNIVFAGTTITHGYAEAIVFSIGESSQVGKIIKLTSQTKKISKYEVNINHFSKTLVFIIFGILFLVFLLNVTFHSSSIRFIELMLFLIALAVSVVPEALPIVTTVTMSIGALKLSKHKVVTKRISALEDLGNIDILCTDKTGTLTENILSIKDVVILNKNLFYLYSALVIEEPLLRKKTIAHSFDDSIRNYLEHSIKEKFNDYTILKTLPFDPKVKRKAVIVKCKSNDNEIQIYLGAPEELIKSSTLSSSEKNKELANISREGENGFRTIGIAFSKIKDSSVEFLGYYIFEDPLKPSAISTIETAKKIGLKIKILSGDSLEVSQFVGQQIGLIHKTSIVYSGEQIDKMSDVELSQAVKVCDVFARMDPEQKYKIIKCLKITDSVAYQGDGINDTPALKLADVAIAVDTASDVAKDAADIILLQNDLGVLINGIRYGRKVFLNIEKYIKHAMIGNFGTLYVLCILQLFSASLPLLPIQLLLSNLITDIPLLAISTDNVDFSELKKPEQFNTVELFRESIILAIIYVIFTFIFLYILPTQSEKGFQTSLFIFFSITSLIIIFSIRTKKIFFKAKVPSKPLIILSILVIGIIFLIPYTFLKTIFNFTSIDLVSFETILLISLVYFITLDLLKVKYFNFFNLI